MLLDIIIVELKHTLNLIVIAQLPQSFAWTFAVENLKQLVALGVQWAHSNLLLLFDIMNDQLKLLIVEVFLFGIVFNEFNLQIGLLLWFTDALILSIGNVVEASNEIGRGYALINPPLVKVFKRLYFEQSNFPTEN